MCPSFNGCVACMKTESRASPNSSEEGIRLAYKSECRAMGARRAGMQTP